MQINKNKISRVLILSVLFLFLSCPFVMNHDYLPSSQMAPMSNMTHSHSSHTENTNNFVNFSHSDMLAVLIDFLLLLIVVFIFLKLVLPVYLKSISFSKFFEKILSPPKEFLFLIFNLRSPPNLVF